MSLDTILNALDTEIQRLKQARAVLADGGSPVTSKRGRPRKDVDDGAPVKKSKKHNISPEARERISAAVKARWAKQKKAK